MSPGIIHTALQAIVGVFDAIKKGVGKLANAEAYTGTHSLIDTTKITRVEPLTIISKDLLNLDYLIDINQALLNIFSGYYLQAVAILTRVHDVKVVRILDSLNPNRDHSGLLIEERIRSSQESFKHLSLEEYKYRLPTHESLALEANEDDNNIKLLNEVSNLSVGKMLNVSISFNSYDTEIKTIGGVEHKEKTTNEAGDMNEKGSSSQRQVTEKRPHAVTLPIAVRLLASLIPNSSIIQLLTLHKEDISLVERWHAYRSGRIEFVKDLIFCQDLVNEYKKAMIQDDSGSVLELIRRVNNSKRYGLLTNNPSLVSASTLFIISEQIAKEIELKLGGKLSNPLVRQKIFDNSYAMIIVVVDRDYERVIFYSRGVNAATNLSVKEVKASNKGKGPDIFDIMKSIQMGMPPTF